MLDGERIAAELLKTTFKGEEIFQNVAMHVEGERLINLNRSMGMQVPTQIYRRLFGNCHFAFIFPYEDVEKEPTKAQEKAVEMQPFVLGIGEHPTALYAVGSNANRKIAYVLAKGDRNGGERYCPPKARDPSSQAAGDTVGNSKLHRP